MFSEVELFFPCPYCMQEISVLVEVLYGNQSYVEDCEVCCQPLMIHYEADEGEIRSYDVKKLDD